MHPVFREFLAISSLALGDLVFMVREYQVFPACVDINLLAKVFLGHLRALDMPSRTAIAPWRLPCRLPFLLWLPQYEVQWIFLLILACYQKGTLSRTQVIQILVGQFAIFFKFPGAIVYGAVLLIGISFVNQGLDHVNHAADLFRSQGILGGRFNIHAIHILLAFRDITLGNLVGRYPFFDRPFDNLVIYIRKVGNIIYIVAFVFKISPHRIKYDHGPCISDVNEVIYGRPAYVHLYLSFLQRHEFFLLLGQRVIQLHIYFLPPCLILLYFPLSCTSYVFPSPEAWCAA